MAMLAHSSIAAAIAVLFTPSAALADEIFAATPSRTAEALFDMPPAATVSALVSACIDRGWSVAGSTGSQVTCELPVSTDRAILGQLSLGNSYSTSPRQYAQFNVVGTGASTRVQVNEWIELQMAFGQVRRTDFQSASAHNSQIAFLLSIGGRLPPGTTFPNHALLGFDGSPTRHEGRQGLKVISISPGSAADDAGLRVGDIVFRIAGKRWKDDLGYLDAIAEAAESPTYPVVLIREGEQVTLTFARAFRPTVAAPAIAASSEQPHTEAPAPAALSVADELVKLADLRDRGVLTEDEFQTQKQRVLQAD